MRIARTLGSCFNPSRASSRFFAETPPSNPTYPIFAAFMARSTMSSEVVQ